jgi:dUTP pyrophosphatase
MKIKLLSSTAKVPAKETGNAGYDLFAAHAVTIPPLERALILTDISLEIPSGYYGRIADRSGMAFKNGGTVLAGVIDESYRGPVGIVLHNTDPDLTLEVKVGDRPAQLIIEKYYEVDFELVHDLSESNRQEKGFGSSGR